ncbi:Protein of unknown function [Beijerinckia sp. 28-YEA-48]|nr:Protein of unknown function [Beijerinckia sp. 28-YEA-48]
MAFGRNLMVLATAIFALGAYGTVRGAMTLSWPRTSATITSAELLLRTTRETRSNGRAEEESWHTFRVLYHYRVGDQEYVAGGVEPYDLGMQNSAGAVKMRERHPIGSTADIAYDPQNPAVSYLEPGPSSFALALSGLGAFMFLCGFWVRRMAAKGLGEMNAPGATENINKALKDGDRF